MLLKDFYDITHFNLSGEELFAGVRLNPKHEIYAGHFPEQAVVPGVVQLQMVKELLEKAVSKELLISEIVQAKYLRMITPAEHTKLTFHLNWSSGESGDYLIKATVSDEQHVFTKIKAKLSGAT